MNAASPLLDTTALAASLLEPVRNFVTTSLKRPVPDATNIFESGLVSSMFGMQLIMYMEKSFSIMVLDEDLDLGNFSSIENIARFIARKRQ